MQIPSGCRNDHGRTALAIFVVVDGTGRRSAARRQRQVEALVLQDQIIQTCGGTTPARATAPTAPATRKRQPMPAPHRARLSRHLTAAMRYSLAVAEMQDTHEYRAIARHYGTPNLSRSASHAITTTFAVARVATRDVATCHVMRTRQGRAGRGTGMRGIASRWPGAAM